MKKSIRIVAIAMALLMVAFVFASCGKTLSGSYSAEIAGTGATYTFKGSKVTITYKVLGTEAASFEGTYKIKDDKITITLDSDDKDAEKYSGTHDFAETENGIKIGIIEYTKK